MRRYWLWVLSLVVLMALPVAIYSLKAAPGATPVPHPVPGNEKCLNCHGAQSVKPFPPSHAAFNEGSCLTCHPAAAPSSPQSSCQSCHGRHDATLSLPGGEVLNLYVDPELIAASVHGDKLACTDCHSSITTYPHPKRVISSRREYSIGQYELCKQCHFANYTKTLDSVHYDMFSKGDLGAPLCTDCHGAHDVKPPAEPRAKISQTCARCHDAINQVYTGSVHGKALIGENNYDVPVCTDCHQSHTIEDARTAAFRQRSVGICSDCHSNKKLMQKYGISTNVVKSYLADFHGKSVALVEKQNRDIWAAEAVCTDCHGVHDILKVDAPDSPVIKANLLATCQKCHPDATANFPGAWLSHYQPSVNRAPMVFFAGWFYRILIPFILVGLSVHILLDVWRMITNR